MALPTPSADSAALITGASSGLGTDIARELAQRGHNLVLVARRKDKLDELAEELRSTDVRVETLACDLTDSAALDALPGQIEALGLRVDVLINNAGYGSAGPFIKLDPAAEALVVFQGPEAYVTPSWYAAKAESGKVVPTWNYAVVQVHGRIRTTDDPHWLRAQIEALTDQQEGRRVRPWHVSDAPAPYVEAQIRNIVGIEIAIFRIEGKWKASQNRPAQDQPNIVAGLNAEGATAMANIVRQRGGGEHR